MSTPLNDTAQDQLFRTARTRNGWTDESIPEALIREVYDLSKWGSTSANCSPARYVWIGSAEAKERLKPLLLPNNVEKTMSAQWTVIVAWDEVFFDKIPELFPHNPGARDWFNGSPEVTFDAGFRNGTLQGAYLMMAARALGLDCGPMSGFNKVGVDEAFLAGTTWKSNFLCNIGYGTDANLFGRLPRLSFDDACKIV
jgi:3-hydroxypropanoate dehydrogenase